MKTLILFIGLTIGIYGQFALDTINVDIGIPAPQEVIDEIYTLKCFYETREVGEVMYLFGGMSLEQAESIFGDSVSVSYSGIQPSFGFGVIANGWQYNLAVFGLDSLGNELIYVVNEHRYLIRSGVSGIGYLPLIPSISDTTVYIQVNVNFD